MTNSTVKNILITGTTSGVGLATARALLGQGHRLVMLVRNTQKAAELFPAETATAQVTLISCDLADLDSVRKASDAVTQTCPQIDVFIANAGGMYMNRRVNTNGYEMHMAMNHLGHFLLTTLLLPVLLASKARVISLSSEAHRQAKLDLADFHLEKSFAALKAYGNSKLANIYMVKELHRRYHAQGLSAFAVHPGVVATGFGNHLGAFGKGVWALMKPFLITAEKGAQTSVYLATAEGVENLSGLYFKNSQPVKPSKAAEDEEMARKVWEISERYTSI